MTLSMSTRARRWRIDWSSIGGGVTVDAHGRICLFRNDEPKALPGERQFRDRLQRRLLLMLDEQAGLKEAIAAAVAAQAAAVADVACKRAVGF